MARRTTVILDAELAARFGAYCSKYGFKKSTLIARLVRDLVTQEHGSRARPNSRRRTKSAKT